METYLSFIAALHEIAKAIRQREKKAVPERWIQLSAGLINIGNMALGALLFGQALNNKPFNYSLGLIGIFFCIILYIISLILMKGE